MKAHIQEAIYSCMTALAENALQDPLTRASQHQSLPPRTLPAAADLPEADYLCLQLVQGCPAYGTKIHSYLCQSKFLPQGPTQYCRMAFASCSKVEIYVQLSPSKQMSRHAYLLVSDARFVRLKQ